jgi:hypothetical protein
MEIDMAENAVIAQAVRKVKDREITYTWRSKDQSIEFEGELVGGYVNLRLSHDSDRKQFTAFIRFAHYDRSQGYEVVKFAVYDMDGTYPCGMVATQPIARYSAKALGEFETRVIDYLNSVNLLGGNGDHGKVREVWARATEIAMGGDGTLRYSEYVAI